MPLQGTGLFTCSSYPDIVLQFNTVLNTVSELSGSVTLLLEADKPFEHPFPAIVPCYHTYNILLLVQLTLNLSLRPETNHFLHTRLTICET